MDAPEALVKLRLFRDCDLALYAEWLQQLATDALMSRIYPRAMAEGFPRDDRLPAWYVIEVNRQAVGTVWLEKDAV